MITIATMKFIPLILLMINCSSFAEDYQKQPPSEPTTEKLNQLPESPKQLKKEGAQGPIRVTISGYIKKPGVYQLKKGATVLDAVNAAGGMTRIGGWHWSFIREAAPAGTKKSKRIACERTKKGVQQFKMRPLKNDSTLMIDEVCKF